MVTLTLLPFSLVSAVLRVPCIEVIVRFLAGVERSLGATPYLRFWVSPTLRPCTPPSDFNRPLDTFEPPPAFERAALERSERNLIDEGRRSSEDGHLPCRSWEYPISSGIALPRGGCATTITSPCLFAHT
jgi:hypothetical protein